MDRCANARVTVWTDVHLCTPVGYRTLAPVSKSSGKNSGSISPQSLMNWLLCRLAEAGFWSRTSVKSKGKQMKPKWGRNLPNSPVWSPICLHSFRRCVRKKWVLTCPVGLCKAWKLWCKRLEKNTTKLLTRIKQKLNETMSIEIKIETNDNGPISPMYKLVW